MIRLPCCGAKKAAGHGSHSCKYISRQPGGSHPVGQTAAGLLTENKENGVRCELRTGAARVLSSRTPAATTTTAALLRARDPRLDARAFVVRHRRRLIEKWWIFFFLPHFFFMDAFRSPFLSLVFAAWHAHECQMRQPGRPRWCLDPIARSDPTIDGIRGAMEIRNKWRKQHCYKNSKKKIRFPQSDPIPTAACGW